MIEESVNVITKAKFVRGSSFERLKPLTIFFENDLVLLTNTMMHKPRLTIEVPSSFLYTDNKMVPWNYNCNYVNESAVKNISGIGGTTRSGRCYMPVTIETAPPKPVEEIPEQKESEVVLDMIKDKLPKKTSNF